MKNCVNWSMLVNALRNDLKSFAVGELSGTKLYDNAKTCGVGGEARSLIRLGVKRARKNTREALRRRNLLS